MRKIIFICFFNFTFLVIEALHASTVDLKPVSVISNPYPNYTLINSVEFHPNKNLFCVTFTHANKIGFYELNDSGNVNLIQMLQNSLGAFSEPQHAIFSQDGNELIVANWTNETLGFYQSNENIFTEKPTSIIPLINECKTFKPHGIAISPSESLFAIAYGASINAPKAIGLYTMVNSEKRVELVSLLLNPLHLGIPKGITFSPDERCLLVTFCDENAIVIYSIENNQLVPLQIIQGPLTQLSRPEDIKIYPAGNYVAVSNSDARKVTFYRFDKISNSITEASPAFVLEGPLANLCIPHGIAFSSDGNFLAITDFGNIKFTPTGGLNWVRVRPNEAKIKIFRTDFLK